jgi:hypothetical protein
MDVFYKTFGIGIIALLLLIARPLAGQEFNAMVTVNHDQIQRQDVQIFKTLETSVFELINNTKWTGDNYTMEERIECNFVLILEKMPTQSEFVGKLQVQFARPVYNSSYLSTILNHQDPDFYYLTGLREPNSLLIIFKEPQLIDSVETNEIIFVQDRNPQYELWNGRRLG